MIFLALVVRCCISCTFKTIGRYKHIGCVCLLCHNTGTSNDNFVCVISISDHWFNISDFKNPKLKEHSLSAIEYTMTLSNPDSILAPHTSTVFIKHAFFNAEFHFKTK